MWLTICGSDGICPGILSLFTRQIWSVSSYGSFITVETVHGND